MSFCLHASRRRLALLFASCFAIVVLLSYNNLLQQSLESTERRSHTIQHNELSQDGGRIEVVGEDTVAVSAIEATVLKESTSSEQDNETTSKWSPGISAGELNHTKTHKDARDRTQAKIQDLLKAWTPPNPHPNHWPPYEWYVNQDYDPNRWEGFDWENSYYVNNGIEQFTEDPEPYLPYPQYNSVAWKHEWKGKFVPCKGARDQLLNESDDDAILAFSNLPASFPLPVIGDAEALGIETHYCFDRHGRYGPYGNGQGDDDITKWKRPLDEPDWSKVDWGALQDQCLVSNRHRYRPKARRPFGHPPDKDMPLDSSKSPPDFDQATRKPRYHSRTALLIRTWSDYAYTENDMHSIRALITELSLFSGGEFEIFLLVHVKKSASELWSDSQAYQDALEENVPAEFQSISILWNERLLEEWYPSIGDWNVYWHQFMPLQWFSKLYPEFDFVWNWEADARYTGHHYHLLDRVARFATEAPRKYLWERNSRFYIPAAHRTYEQWLNDTDAAIESAMLNSQIKPVWGPQPYDKIVQDPIGPAPPRQMESDRYEWGVGEEADLITLQPIWDPTLTMWTYRDKIFNYVPGVRPHFTEQDPLDANFHHPDFINIPRRTFINTVARFSRRQLHAMHIENSAGRTMQAEMWPATVSLQHGLKAVYAPHSIWADHKWPAWYMDAIFNADGHEEARWGARADSVYNHDREHNFGGWSWYYDSKFARVLYRRWLGWSATVGSEEECPNNPLRTLGGEQFENEGFNLRIQADSSKSDGTSHAIDIHVGGQGRMCLPPMLLHPVKHVYEEAEGPVVQSKGLLTWLQKLFHW